MNEQQAMAAHIGRTMTDATPEIFIDIHAKALREAGAYREARANAQTNGAGSPSNEALSPLAMDYFKRPEDSSNRNKALIETLALGALAL